MTFYEKVPKDASPGGLLNASLYIEGSALSICAPSVNAEESTKLTGDINNGGTSTSWT
jgi:hypothetical protein